MISTADMLANKKQKPASQMLFLSASFIVVKEKVQL